MKMPIFSTIFLAALPAFASNTPMPLPIFLKMGFSSVLEFDEAPTRVVLGDAQSFQVEKLEQSLVVRTLAPYATSNMFVYFRNQDTRFFVLTSSEDAEPTFFSKFSKPSVPKAPASPQAVPTNTRATRVLNRTFDIKKDYLTIEVEIVAGSKESLKPRWDWVRLNYSRNSIAPYKLWAERKEVQKDSRVKARFIFAKPNVPRDLRESSLVIPILGQASPISLPLRVGK